MRGKMRRFLGLACLPFLVLGVQAQTTLYYTQFEQSEGFDPEFTLAGQEGWTSFGTGGNGLVEEFIPGHGQQAYVGFFPPTGTDEFTTVWRPINYAPTPEDANIVRFSVLLDFEPSTVGGQDDFRWSIYNVPGDRLFSIDFETSTGRISMLLQDEIFQDTGWTFGFDGVYTLEVWMDFARNYWTAKLNGVVIINSQPITTLGSELSFGDADAVWSIRDPAAPGDNFMMFDEYLVVAEAVDEIPPTLEAVGLTEEGFFQFYIFGTAGLDYSVEVTSDFETWYSLGNFLAEEEENGTILFEDITTAEIPLGFYRVGPPLPE